MAKRRSFELKVLLPFLAGGLVGIPIGVAVLPLLNVEVFKAVLGGILLIWCPFMLFAQQLPPVRAGGRLADGTIGLVGGVMAGIGGFAGAVPSLWCRGRTPAVSDQAAGTPMPIGMAIGV